MPRIVWSTSADTKQHHITGLFVRFALLSLSGNHDADHLYSTIVEVYKNTNNNKHGE